MSVSDVLRVEFIVVIALILIIGTIIPGIRLYWPRRDDPVSQTDLGVALMGGAFIAFAVLVLQLLIQFRAESDSRDREERAQREAQLLVLSQSANLAGVDLGEDDLEGAYLIGKVLRNANLEDANLKEASLQGSDLAAANLVDAELDDARIDRADLRYANLRDAELPGAHLTGARLDAATLVDADLAEADLSNAWVRADLARADLRGAILVGARFAPANLQGADLRDADLQFADLRGANLKGAKLKASDGLRDARNLNSAKDWSSVKYDAETEWPDYFEWDGQHPPECKVPTCRLTAQDLDASEFPPPLRQMQARLTEAMRKPRCLPGWRLNETPFSVVAQAPRDARLEIRHWVDPTGDAEKWAVQEFGDEYDKELFRRRPLGRMSFEGGRAYAEHVLPREKAVLEGRPLRSMVAVYFVRGSSAPNGYRLAGSASSNLFDLYQRDFLTLFSLLGVEGDLFPALQGERGGCPV
jgi:uncharacterized protein YjbI with pentapeptide repeats